MRATVLALITALALSSTAEAQDTCPPEREIHAYDALAPGTRGWITAQWDGRVWVPASQLSMPLHHASRIDWVDAERHPELARHDRPLRIAFEVIDRRLERSQHEGVLAEATYRVRITAICR